MSDEIIEELWQIKDSIAREHDYDIESLVAHLQTKQRSADQQVVDLSVPEADCRPRCSKSDRQAAPLSLVGRL